MPAELTYYCRIVVILVIEELWLNSPIASNFQCCFDVLLNKKGEVMLDVCVRSRVFRQIVEKLFELNHFF